MLKQWAARDRRYRRLPRSRRGERRRVTVRRGGNPGRFALYGIGMELLGHRVKLSTFQIGTPAKRGQGLRIGTTRRPHRGVPKTAWKDYFDVWLPTLAPSEKLRQRFWRKLDDPAR